ncbi:hypothetical protein H704_00448 [Bartonella bacilliformis Peru38]|uniref:CvpA protein n=2 Tax=Bartonella bacilliformis TaxID=774 RepID=A1US50_BARBK|nr:CvpA family protein [Bartonella bacilliformis]ABM44678.1 CvpA protein [Bartonella bacilliformis KC583]AMG85636.1 CvpA protein [Bartonella bacilliformis]EKS45053.1 CvpA protein [Bartonella bacilliformis INS]EYS90068.1 hypothetical protein X472_00522 [Bartonella bacilliformis San Pedro600-02]EYS95029.1 hypothetical protein X470_00541 [Bartonella bacilliformis Peru-18]
MDMTILDGVAIVIILCSSLLAMLRGFSREVLSLTSWIVAAFITLFLCKPILPFTNQYISHAMITLIALIALLIIIFIIVLSIISIITMKIANFIINSRIGIIDRTVGFIFGAVRGALIILISMLLVDILLKLEQKSDMYILVKSTSQEQYAPLRI